MKQKNVSKENVLKDDNVRKTLMKLAIPSIIGMVVNGIYNVVDTLFVGKLGTQATGAISVAFPFIMLIAAFGLATGVGGASYISRSLGKGNKDEANLTASTSILMTLIIGIFFVSISYFYIENILILFGATETILPDAIDYSKILILGAPIIMIKMTLNNLLRAEGSAKASMIALIIGAGLNIILDPIFIFTFNMGIQGAAIATIIGQSVAVAFQVWYYASGRSYLKISFKNFKLKKIIITQIIIIGLPLFFTQGLNSFAMAMINNAARPYGDSAVAAMGIVKRVMALGIFAVIGYSQGFQPVAGFNYGAKQYDKLFEAIKFSVRLVTGFTITISILCLVFADNIIGLFSTDPDVIEVGVIALKAYIIPFPLIGFQMIYFSLFQALGKAVPAGILSISRQGLLLIPIALILPDLIGINGVILAQPIADTITILMTAVLAFVINRSLKREAENNLLNQKNKVIINQI